jgi:adenylate kinase family enzyme
MLKKNNSHVNIAIKLETTTWEAIRRLSGRSKTQKARPYDMNTDVIIHRLEEWENTIKKDVVSFYQNQSKLIEIDGTGTDEEVFDHVDKAIAGLMPRS